MTTEAQTAAPAPAKPAPMPVGGTVMAMVPQTFEELTRISSLIVNGHLSSLVETRGRTGESPEDLHKRNIAKINIVLMAGAELGLPPMVSLRSFTVINNRPALYADGNIAVIRKAKIDGKPICEYIRQGFEVGTSDETTFAWVEAKRADNGEVHREEFSVADAKQAGLWDDNAMVDAEVWEGPKGARRAVVKKVPNPSPWFRFRRRMMMWRAGGYCLRWLFADVLGGMTDEYEAREIASMIDVTPTATAVVSGPPMPPPPPADDEGEELHNSDQQEGGENEETNAAVNTIPQEGVTADEQIDLDSGEVTAKATAEVPPSFDDNSAPPPPPAEDDTFPGDRPMPKADTSEVGRFLLEIEDALAAQKTEATIEKAWDDLDVQVALADDPEALTQAFAIKAEHIQRGQRLDAIAAGQGDLLGGGS